VIILPATSRASEELDIDQAVLGMGPTCEIRAGDVLLAVAGGMEENGSMRCWLVTQPDIFIYKKTFASGVKKFFQKVAHDRPEIYFLTATNLKDPLFNRFIQWLGFKFKNTEFHEDLGKVNVYGYQRGWS